MSNPKKIKSILYAEDDLAAQEVLAGFLKYYCDELYVANNGEEGLSLYKEHHPDIVISDIKMPKMDGIAMAKGIFELKNDCHIIFTTAFTELKYLQEAIEIHVDAYVTKPINLETLDTLLLKLIKIENTQQELDKKIEDELKRKAELETILTTTKDGIAILDLDANFLYTNKAYQDMIGYAHEELKEKGFITLSILEDQEKNREALNIIIKDNYLENFETKCITKAGKVITVEMSASLMPDQKRILLSTRNITQNKRANKLIKEYIKLIDENIITSSTDTDGLITYASEAFVKISGYEKKELLGKNHNIIKHEDTPDEIFKEIWETISKNQIWEGELKNKKKNGEVYWVHNKIYPLFDDEHNKTGYTAIREDITYLKQVEELAIVDGLTGVYNRHHFNETLPNYIQSAKRNDELICFAMFDIDFFKQYNDTYGHQAGDTALIKVAKAVQKMLNRGDDYLFRLGGEEFGILFKSNTKRDAIEYTKQIIQAVRDLNIEHKKSTIRSYLTVSIGLMCKKANEIENEDLLFKETDDLLYKAKERGRDQIVCIDENSHE